MRRLFFAAAFVLTASNADAQQRYDEVVLGSGFGLARTADGQVHCWGESGKGQCGVRERSVSRRAISSLHDVDEIDAGYTFACARSAGEVRCWGGNRYHQLGNDTMDDSAEPQLIEGLPPVQEVALGSFSACALAQDGAVWCWGLGSHGQLGPAVDDNRARPVRIPRVRNATRLFSGYNHFCTLDGRGALTCWGANDYGQAGSRRQRNAPPRRVRGTGTIRDVALGDSFSCLITDDGRLRCWGSDLSTIGDAARATQPTEHPTVRDATGIDLDGEDLCVVTSSHQLLCWGVNRRGQLNVPTNEMGGIVIVPTAVPNVNDAQDVTMHHMVQCYQHEDGRWSCWGRNTTRNRVGVDARENMVTSPTPLPGQ